MVMEETIHPIHILVIDEWVLEVEVEDVVAMTCPMKIQKGFPIIFKIKSIIMIIIILDDHPLKIWTMIIIHHDDEHVIIMDEVVEMIEEIEGE